MAKAKIKVLPELNTPAQQLQIILTHDAQNIYPKKVRTVFVKVATDSDLSSKRITKIDRLKLVESKPNSSVFLGNIKLTPDKKKVSGDLEVLPGDLVTLSYDAAQLEPSGKKGDAIVSEVLEISSFDPEFSLDKEFYNIGDKVRVTMSDPGANVNPNTEDPIQFRVFSDSDPGGIAIEGKETGKDTGVFRGVFNIGSDTTMSCIKAGNGDTVTIAYTSEFPADYSSQVENEEDPKKSFFFSFDVGIPLQDEKVLERLKGYFDPKIYDKIRRGAFLATTNKTVTIVFWDIRGFSRMCEILRSNPKMIVDFLQAYCDIAAEVIAFHGGILDKFIGDGVMALFGVYGSANGQNPESAAVNAALDFREEFLKLVTKWKPVWTAAEEQEIELALGCGINTGEVIVGTMGNARQQFTVVGRSVNIASRLESRSKNNKILITSRTKTKISQSIKTVYVGKIRDMKNIPGNYLYYEVVK